MPALQHYRIRKVLEVEVTVPGGPDAASQEANRLLGQYFEATPEQRDSGTLRARLVEVHITRERP